MIAGSLDKDEFIARATRSLRPEPPGLFDPRSDTKGDHALNPDHASLLPRHPTPAAVLVPIVMHDEEPAILFTERATGLRNHSGQISFPGGRVDADDPSALAAALREAEEEIGLDPKLVRPVGYLDGYLSSTGYFVTPVVGLLAPGVTFRLNEAEVADVFEVPLGFLMDETNHQLHAREWKGKMRQYYAMPFQERYIWGVTAGILRNMYQRLYAR